MAYEEIERYGVKLCRLSRSKIEMIRQWRNDPKISQYMIYRDYITIEQQEKWFDRINNEKNYYFIMSYKGEDVGLINIKDIDDNFIHGEGGVFVYNDKFLNTDFSYRAHLCLFDFAFEILKLKYITSEILGTNKRAIRFTEFLGFKLTGNFKQGNLYILTKEDYFANKNRERFIIRENKKQKNYDKH